MLSSYLPVLMLLGVAILFPTSLVIFTSLVGPKLHVNSKFEPYECGVPPVSTRRDRLPVKFYKVAIIFLVFDVEAAFLFPWAVLFKKKLMEWGPVFLVSELLLFLLILVAGYIYAWRAGALEWD